MWFDAGVNLTNKRLLKDLDGVMLRAQQAEVRKQLIISTSIDEAEQAIKLCQQFPEQLVMTVGIHPHDAGEAPTDYKQKLKELAQHPGVVAIGECGLDFNRNYSPRPEQEAVFVAQIELANELNLPLYLHERDAIDRQIELLNQYCADNTLCLTHCFTGGADELKRYAKRGHWFGITGWLCDDRRNQELVAALPNLPLDRLVLETDAPFLLPRGIKPRPKMNEPALLPVIGETLAKHLQISTQKLAELTYANTERFFGPGEQSD
ncbi:TatD family hydrolase [Idiomarina sp. ST10R2A5]|uniref:TatD family hydrolase n=1 Tax=Idiomarina sp. ST10R2A5 TaxID=3418368 RepID=UPI003EC5D76E